MASKDVEAVRGASRRRWRALWWMAGIATVGTLSVVMSRSWGPGPAQAQAPRAAGKTGAPAPVVPAAAPTTAKSPAKTPTAPAKTNGSATGNGSANAAGGNAVRQASAQQPSTENQVVALVNNEQITRQELAKECLERYGREVLESIINKQLILQACLQRNIKITEQDVTDEIEKVAKKFGLSTDRWMQLLQEERNVTAADYRREIIWPTLALRALATEQMKVSGEELRKAFESEYGDKVRVRVIAVSSQKKAEELLAKAKAAPDDFGVLAKDHSEDPSASVMGIVPPIRHHGGDQNFEKIAFGLKKGEISPVVKVANQHVIMKCEEHIEATYLAGAQLKIAQEQLQDRIRDQKLRTASADLFKQLQEQAKVVNIYNDPQKQKSQPGVAAIVNGQSVTIRQLAEECILRHGSTVLDGEINRRILQQELKRRNRTVDDNDIQDEVTRAADSYGYVKKDGSPDVDAWLKAITEKDGATIELYVRDAVWPSAALKKISGANVQITEDDLKKGFESNYGERVEVLAVVLGNQRQAQQVWELARDNPAENFFAELAHTYSIEPASRSNFGKVPPLRRHGGQPALEEAAFRLKPGELSSIVAVGDKFIILRCTGRTKPVVSEMTPEVRQELAKDIAEKKLRVAMAKEFDRLKESSKVEDYLTGASTSSGKAKSPASASPNLVTPGELVLPNAPAGVAPQGNAPARTASPPRAGSAVKR